MNSEDKADDKPTCHVDYSSVAFTLRVLFLFALNVKTVKLSNMFLEARRNVLRLAML